MYTSYFGLAEPPFAISPNPRYLYLSEHHREALAHLIYGITSDGCMILLTGDVGTGKTTLCRCLLEQLPEDTEVAVIINPRLTTRELLKTVCEEFGIFHESSTGSIKAYIDALNVHLLRAHANDRNIAIIIDEAQNLSSDVLEQLRLLTNLETPTRKLLRIMLIGQPELRTMLERPELAQVNQRVTSRYHLGPLEPAEVRAYIQHRLRIAGDPDGTLISPKAVKHAIALTGGIPRLINVLCDRALLGAYAVNAERVDLEIMKRAGEEVFPNTRQQRSRRSRLITAAVVALGMLAVPLLVFVPTWFSPDKQPASPPAVSEQQESAPAAGPATPQQTTETMTAPAEKGPAQQSDEASSSPQDVAAPTGSQTAPTAQPPADPPMAEMKTQSAATATIASQKNASDNEGLSPEADGSSTEQQANSQNGTQGEIISATTQPPEPPLPQPAETIIRISSPMLIKEKAGPEPVQTTRKLLSR